jgi:predicted GNAT family N-acyltransferase
MTSQRSEHPITTHIAEASADRDLCYRLRYRVYIDEFHCKIPTADREHKLDRTKDDANATLFYANMGDEMIGTVRVHHGAVADIPTYFVEACQVRRFLADTPLSQMMTIGRLAIAAHHRGGMAAGILIRDCLSFFSKSYADTKLIFILPPDEPRLIALYRMLGFRPVDETRKYTHDLGLSVPMFLCVDERGRKWLKR